MGQIILSDKIKFKLTDLSEILYNKNYFGYKESAEKYVQHIRDFIETIPNQPLKLCLKPTYGKYYAQYKNKPGGFIYYITYNEFESDYFIKDIISPKTREYLSIMSLK